MMRNLSIKWQIGLVVGLAAIGMLCQVGLQQYAFSHLEALKNAQVLVGDIESGMLMLRRNEKDFIARKDLIYVNKFRKNYTETFAKTNQLNTALNQSDIEGALVMQLAAVLDAYQQHFLALVELQRRIGLDHHSGLYGRLRESVHQAEERMKAQQQLKLTVDMLMLRRREKDFMLRLDLAYLDKFNKDLAIFSGDLAAAPLAEDDKQSIALAMKNYATDFEALVNANVRLGLSSKEGLFGEMRQTIHQSEELLTQLRDKAGQRIASDIAGFGVNALLFSVALMLALFGMMALIIPGIINPIEQLSALMSQTSRERDVTVRSDESAPREIAAMAHAFNQMMGVLQEIVARIEDTSNQLRSASEQLSRIAQMANVGVHSQRAETEQVASAMTEMTATAQEVASHASSAASASAAADQATQQGSESVKMNKEGIQVLADEVMGTANIISELNKESENIGMVLGVIRGIADQTNLLALNAAIEAARAGAQGRGFAVVADEVRALAQRSQESTQEIQKIVERLQETALRAVSAMGKSKEQAQESVLRSEVAAESLAAIQTAISVIKDMNLQIATAAEQQSAVSEDINRNIVNISSLTGENITNSEQTMETVNSLSSMAVQLKELVGRFKIA